MPGTWQLFSKYQLPGLPGEYRKQGSQPLTGVEAERTVPMGGRSPWKAARAGRALGPGGGLTGSERQLLPCARDFTGSFHPRDRMTKRPGSC